MRPNGIAIAWLLMSSACVAKGQTWPSAADIFRDVYGSYDSQKNSVPWDVSKEPKPSPFWGHSFANSGEEMAVRVIFRAEADGKLYVATSAVPKNEPDAINVTLV